MERGRMGGEGGVKIMAEDVSCAHVCACVCARAKPGPSMTAKSRMAGSAPIRVAAMFFRPCSVGRRAKSKGVARREGFGGAGGSELVAEAGGSKGG